MDILYIVMPAYNEETNIENVVNQWMQVGVNKMIIADSGSTDSTHEKLLNLQKTYPQLVILSNTEKQHGPKLMALYDYSIKTVQITFFKPIPMDRQILKNLLRFGA